DGLVSAGAAPQRPIRCRFHLGGRVLFREPDDPQTRSITHLRMRLFCQDPLEQQCSVRSDLLGPVHHARGSPLQVCLVTLRPMFALGECLASSTATKMRGYPLSLVEDLY